MDEYAVRDVVRDVIAVVAVNELFIVDGLMLRDDAAVVRTLKRGGRRNEPLGFGVDELAALATPVVWLAVDEMAKQITTRATDGAITGLKGVARKVFRREKGPVTIPALSREQLGEVQRLITELAAERGLDAERAQSIADAVVARLAADPTADEPRSTDSPGTHG